MSEGATKPTKLFVGCFEFTPDPDLAPPGDDDGTFQIVVEATDAQDAANRCRARLREIAAMTDELGPVIVYANAFIEVAPSDLIRGMVINHQALGEEVSYCFLPPQGEVASVEHSPDEHEEGGNEADDLEEVGVAETEADATNVDDDNLDDDESLLPIFWANWKLYWCQTPDHDEDAFVVALSAAEAAAVHEDAEGYDEADAEFVRVLPDTLQYDADREHGGWPSDAVLLACGAEFIPYVSGRSDAELRKQLGSRVRVVRINGRTCSEGDIVSNAKQRPATEPDA